MTLGSPAVEQFPHKLLAVHVLSFWPGENRAPVGEPAWISAKS